MRGGAEARLLGKWGEMQVANYLRKQGYNIVDVNYRCRLGELDLVATNRKYLAFVEVKLRRNDDIMTARESVTRSKQRKLRAAALLYPVAPALSIACGAYLCAASAGAGVIAIVFAQHRRRVYS